MKSILLLGAESSQVSDFDDETGSASGDADCKDVFRPFRAFCTRKDVRKRA